jgi:hypothetical protein
MSEESLTVVSVTNECVFEKIIGITDATMALTVLPRDLPESLVASKRK